MIKKRSSTEDVMEDISEEDSNSTSPFDNIRQVTSASQLTQSYIVSSVSNSIKRHKTGNSENILKHFTKVT